MEFETLEDIAKELTKIPGKVRGEIFLDHAEYIKQKEGRGGLKKLEEKLSDLGHPISFKKIGALEWKSEGLSSLIVVVSKEIFFWDKDDVFEMGRSAPRFSLGLKLLVQGVVSPIRLFEESHIYWKNLFDFGFLEPVEFNEEEKFAIIRIKGYKTHPLLCTYHAGYLKGLAEFVLKSKNISVTERRCVYKGDSFDEYKLEWR